MNLKTATLFLLILLNTILLPSCGCSNREYEESPIRRDTLKYANFLKIGEYEKYKTIEVVSPWDTARILHRYILIEKGKEIAESLPTGTVVKIPIDNIIVYSSVHASILEDLGALDKIVGVCEPEYITSHSILKKIASGEIADCGNSMAPNVEKIINAGGEIIIASPFENNNYGAAEKLGIPIIEAADYMENHPLGRSEWIKIYGHLLECSRAADSIFLHTSFRYDSLKNAVASELARSGTKRPTIISERKYGSSWGVSGGKSYVVRLYEDAGAKYIFDYLDNTGSIQMSFEDVLSKGIDADIWILKYYGDTPLTYSALKSEYPLYSNFAAFRNRKIFACNTMNTAYYDDITLHPDSVLADLIGIFHPRLLPEHTGKYFLPLLQSR